MIHFINFSHGFMTISHEIFLSAAAKNSFNVTLMVLYDPLFARVSQYGLAC
jgi:hypothetical protein